MPLPVLRLIIWVSNHEKINYIELPARNLEASKHLFSEVFGWSFTDYGPDYTAFSNAGIEGGFYQADRQAQYSQGSALVVLYSDNLEQTLDKIQKAGGKITQPIFSFPGGRRFHFSEPSGNELGVWSAQ